MGFIGPLGALVVVTVATAYVVYKAASWQFKADYADGESDAPRVLLHHTITLWKTAVVVLVVIEIWPGLSTWAYDAWYWVLELA